MCIIALWIGQCDKVYLTVLSILAVPFVFVHMYTKMASQDSSKIKQSEYLVMVRTVKLLIINENGLEEINKKDIQVVYTYLSLKFILESKISPTFL